MARIKGATMTHKRRKKMLKLAKGFYMPVLPSRLRRELPS